jgi:hypothetical protein
MEQNINDFYNQIHQKDFARLFQFRLENFPGLGDDDSKLIYVESLGLPGRAINNIPVPFMGLQFNVPGTAAYPGSDSWSVTFRCDSEYVIRQIFEDQTASIFNDDDSRGNYKIPAPKSAMVLNLLDQDFKPVRQYKFYGAYVVSLGEVSYDIGDGGNIVKLPVTIAYQYWRIGKGISLLGG